MENSIEDLESSPSIGPSVHAQRTGRCQTHRPQLSVGSFRVPASVQGPAEAKKRNIFQTKRWHCFDLGRPGRCDDNEHDSDN